VPDNFAIVIPAFNEAATIHDIVTRSLAISGNVYVIDDGSIDETSEIVRKTKAHLLVNTGNQGKAASMWRGMLAAVEHGADMIITLDADGQHNPEDIPRFIDAAKKQPGKIVIGSRMSEKSAFPKQRYYANATANFWISWAAGYEIEDSQSGFRLYPAALIKKLKLRHDKSRSFVFESEVLIEGARLGFSSVFIPIPALYQENARASHFRSVLDIVRISFMVAWKINSRFLYPAGLYKGVILPACRRARFDDLGPHGVLTLLLSNLLIISTLGISLCWQWLKTFRLARDSRPDAGDATTLIVLGMRLQENKPAQDFKARLDRAVSLYKKAAHRKIYILGGLTGRSNISEARSGADYLLKNGVAKDGIHEEGSSRHTFENLVCVRDLLITRQTKKPVIISNRYHLARCQAFANELKLEHSLCAAEEKFKPGISVLWKLTVEAYYLHWFEVARFWSSITGAKFHQHTSKK